MIFPLKCVCTTHRAEANGMMSQKVILWLGTNDAFLITRKFGLCTVAEALTRVDNLARYLF